MMVCFFYPELFKIKFQTTQKIIPLCATNFNILSKLHDILILWYETMKLFKRLVHRIITHYNIDKLFNY